MNVLALGCKSTRRKSIQSVLAGLACICAIQANAAPPTSPADPHKVLRYVFPAAETGFDPAAINDLYSSAVIQSIFEMLYTYDYLARPVKLVPLTAEALPEVSDGGKTYTIRLKKGIYFTPDAAFGGKARELTMADYVYSFKRLLDPKVHSPNGWMLEGKIDGMDALIAAAKKTGQLNYDTPVAGFELVDRYTLKIHLLKPDFNFGMILAHEPTAAVAREVIEKYHDNQGWVMGHPVGTGPYQLTSWVPGSQIVLTAN
ncbi:MAG: heme-binding protein, partial [Gammaproteobacteria bacterium]|nr:heme-binding protein [Gammaproteobacteria bacterium]